MLLYGIKHDIQYVDTYLFTCVKYKTDAILKMHHNTTNTTLSEQFQNPIEKS
jgi:hypothetical protein